MGKWKMWFVALAASVSAIGVAMAEPGSSTSVRLRFTELEPGGTIRIALFEKAGWRSMENPIRSHEQRVSDRAIEVRFDGLAPQLYGVSAYHDRNENGTLDRLFLLGPPAEPYGFSNNARGRYGPPDWDDASFSAEAGKIADQSIELR